MDTDKDGIISKEEWEAAQKLMVLKYANALEVDIEKLTTR